MKTIFYMLIAILPLAGCKNNKNEQTQKFKDAASKDSAMLVQNTQEDSEMTSYLTELREIGDNLDYINYCEKRIITISTSIKSDKKDSLVAKVKELDDFIVMNDRKIIMVQKRLKRITVKNINLERIMAHLWREVSEKDEEVSILQNKLCKSNSSIQLITNLFNDSILEIKKERSSQSVIVNNEFNTGYFANGTIKELQDKGIVNNVGCFTGIGRVIVIDQSEDNLKFTKTDLTNLKGIGLNGRFGKLLTTHPNNTYCVISNGKNDSIAITNPFAFWCESKYLVVAIK